MLRGRVGISAAPLIAYPPAARPAAAARFTIVIPTWNNLPYLRLCVESIRRNSADGTLDWVRSEGIEHTCRPRTRA